MTSKSSASALVYEEKIAFEYTIFLLILKASTIKIFTSTSQGDACKNHRLNMELDYQSLFGLHVHSCTH